MRRISGGRSTGFVIMRLGVLLLGVLMPGIRSAYVGTRPCGGVVAHVGYSRVPLVVSLARKSSSATSSRGFGSKAPSKKKAKPSKKVASSEGAAARPTNSKWHAFEQWLRDSGAATDAVALTEFGGGLRGVRATRAIRKGEEVMRIPREQILDVERADASPVGGLWSHIPEPLPGYAKLALAVLHEQRLGPASPLAAYVDLLPSMEEFAAEGGPAATWTDEELAATECGKLIHDAQQLRSRRDGNGHPAMQPAALSSRWVELELPGAPPTASEVSR